MARRTDEASRSHRRFSAHPSRPKARARQRILASALLVLGLGANVTSCCFGSISWGVELSVIDQVTACPEEISVAYTVDDEQQPEEVCSAVLDESGRCSCGVILGELKSGEYAISATSADGTRHASAKATVEESAGCQVVTKQLSLSLQ